MTDSREWRSAHEPTENGMEVAARIIFKDVVRDTIALMEKLFKKQEMGEKKMEQTISEIDINGVTYVTKNSQVQPSIEGDLKIVILQRGWVMVGTFSKDGSECQLSNAAVIRSWGTTKGLGELAKNGPIADKTVLDKCYGVVEFDWLTIVAAISCEKKAWKNALNAL